MESSLDLDQLASEKPSNQDLNPYPANIFVKKINVICCIYSNALQTNFINTMDPDQIRLLLREQSDLGPYCLQYRLV